MALGAPWTTVDPLADCSFNEVDGQLQIGIPATSFHDLWTTNKNAPQALQTSANVDFDIKTKIDSAPTTANSGMGIIVKQDANKFIRFDTFTTGSGNHRLFCATFLAGTPTQQLNIDATSFATYPFYLRVKRVGNDFTFYTSPNGTTWTSRLVLTYTLTVNQVGLFAVTAVNVQAFTAKFDWFIVDDVVANIWTDFIETVTPSDTISLTVGAAITVTLGETVTPTDAISTRTLGTIDLTLAEGVTPSDLISVSNRERIDITLAETITLTDEQSHQLIEYAKNVWQTQPKRVPVPESTPLTDSWASHPPSDEDTI